jgi:hypothetical protein
MEHQDQKQQLPLNLADTIATVGHRSLRLNALTTLAAESNVGSREFAQRWAVDSLLAESARAGVLHSAYVDQVERSVLARTILVVLADDARSRGESTEQELRALAAERWFEVDRPSAAQTTHFVVRSRAVALDGSAEQLAHRLALAVRSITSPEEFRSVVTNYPTKDFDVVVESLPPITSDGRSLRLDATGVVIGAGASFDATFARAANSLTQPGAHSSVIHTAFGFHVIMLDRIIPPRKLSAESLREMFASELHSRRTRTALEQVIKNARQQHVVHVESSFQEAAAQLQAGQ